MLQKYVAQKLVRCLEFTGQAEKFIDHCAHQIQLKPGIGLNFIFWPCSVQKGYNVNKEKSLGVTGEAGAYLDVRVRMH